MARYEQDDLANELDHSSGGGNVAPGSQSSYARGIRTLLIGMIVIASLLIFTFNYTHPGYAL
jgi:hypothetical protein